MDPRVGNSARNARLEGTAEWDSPSCHSADRAVAGGNCQDELVSFFTAVLASDGSLWRAKDVDVEECSSLDDLAELMREVSDGDHPALAIIEREDGWFGIVRVDGDEPAAVFVSDLAAVLEGHYAEILGAAADVDVPVPAGVHAYDRHEQEESEDERSEAQKAHDEEAVHDLEEALGGGSLLAADPDPEPTDTWAGDPSLLLDLGIGVADLVRIANDNPDDPATALSAIAEIAGFAELIEALR